MKETFDSSITIFGSKYSPMETKENGSGSSATVCYKYDVDGYSVFLKHFKYDRSTWIIEVTKGKVTLDEFLNANDVCPPKYEGAWVVPLDEVEAVVEKSIGDLGSGRSTMLINYIKSQL